jgi:uncharacterized coiled-coil DUF342 family protein
MSETQQLIEAIKELKDIMLDLNETTRRLAGIQTDIFNTDNSTDDIMALRGSIRELINVIEKKL